MKIGFTTLSLFMKSFEEWLETASKDGFNMMEILCEGPHTWPRTALSFDIEVFQIFESYDIDNYLHAPTIDMNPASLNQGMREEALIQIKETVDMAVKIGGLAITVHPGMIHRLEDRIRDMGKYYALETLTQANEYAEDQGVILSVENMPNRYAYFCNNVEEHSHFIRETGAQATIDLGHANTNGDIKPFLAMEDICYYHLSDNNGDKDQHLSLGEGNINLKLLNEIDKVIIELNNYQNVLKSREVFMNCRGNK
ncbi:MAG: sugar phosphate isomerase/epimerase [Methanobacterium sp.]|jgi:sugar phosphate isomerase/epimerase|nr:sugar phosphate isomerase/epimerase [Methanobacterium sp.]